MSTTGTQAYGTAQGTALMASSSSPPSIVRVAPSPLQRAKKLASSLADRLLAAWKPPISYHAHPQNIEKNPMAIIAGFLGKPEITSLVCKAWRDGTHESYREPLASLPQDPYSLALLELATRRVRPTDTRILTPAQCRKLDSADCFNIFRTIKIIKDEALLRFFDLLIPSIPEENEPANLPDDMHQRASAIRKWMAENQAILDTITTLDFSGRGLDVVPPEIGRLRNLESLNLNNNGITALPPEFGQLAALADLYLSHNQLREFPGIIVQLSALNDLSLSHNQLRELPETIAQLAHLRSLNLEHNQLRELPETIGQLTALQILNLEHNQLRELPKTIGQLAALRALILSDNLLRALPETFGQLAALRALILSDNLLRALPETFGQLAALQWLNLSNNLLRELPETIGQLAALQSLYLEHNQLRALPETIGQLAVLRTLYLSHNPLEALSEALDQLHLHELHLNLDQAVVWQMAPERLERLQAVISLE